MGACCVQKGRLFLEVGRTERGRLNISSEPQRGSFGSEPRPPLRLFGPHQSSLICIQTTPKGLNKRFFLVWFEPNKAGVNTPLESFFFLINRSMHH